MKILLPAWQPSAVAGESVPMCQQLRTSGATDIAKATLLLRAKLPQVPAGTPPTFNVRTLPACPMQSRAQAARSITSGWHGGTWIGRRARSAPFPTRHRPHGVH